MGLLIGVPYPFRVPFRDTTKCFVENRQSLIDRFLRCLQERRVRQRKTYAGL